jgi:hypothetical protein
LFDSTEEKQHSLDCLLRGGERAIFKVVTFSSAVYTEFTSAPRNSHFSGILISSSQLPDWPSISLIFDSASSAKAFGEYSYVLVRNHGEVSDKRVALRSTHAKSHVSVAVRTAS